MRASQVLMMRRQSSGTKTRSMIESDNENKQDLRKTYPGMPASKKRKEAEDVLQAAQAH